MLKRAKRWRRLLLRDLLRFRHLERAPPMDRGMCRLNIGRLR